MVQDVHVKLKGLPWQQQNLTRRLFLQANCS